MINHKLKCQSIYFNASVAGDKPFTIRLNDRDYQIGDTITKYEYNSNKPTGRTADFIITYILKDFDNGLYPNYCILGLKPI